MLETREAQETAFSFFFPSIFNAPKERHRSAEEWKKKKKSFFPLLEKKRTERRSTSDKGYKRVSQLCLPQKTRDVWFVVFAGEALPWTKQTKRRKKSSAASLDLA